MCTFFVAYSKNLCNFEAVRIPIDTPTFKKRESL